MRSYTSTWMTRPSTHCRMRVRVTTPTTVPNSSASWLRMTFANRITDLQRPMRCLVWIVNAQPRGSRIISRALNQVRLVLSSRLKITDEQDAERVHAIGSGGPGHRRESYMALLYNFVSWLQETLMQALIGDIS